MVRPRLGAELERRPVLWSIALTVLWLAVVHLLGAALVAGQEGADADLRAAAVSWSSPRLPAVSWLAFGVKVEPASAALAGALLQIMLGLNEEAMFRGLLQGVWARHPAMAQCGAVALIFGLQHVGNLFFGQSPAETAAQIFSATAFGFAYAGARLHVGSIWGLALSTG